jgi:uroporphyrinogen III methyltransferase/synthase
MPTEYRAEAIIEAIGADRIAGARFLIPRAQTAREVLPERLLAMGAREVIIASVYKTIRPADSDETRVRELAKANKIDLVTFTSSSTVSNFNAIIGDTSPRLKAAAIGPITASTASSLGYEVVVSPQRYTIESLTDAILAYFSPRPH